MKRIFIYLFAMATAVSCTHISKEDIRHAELVLQEADSLAKTTTLCTDTANLRQALQVFTKQDRSHEIAKTQYHLGNAYRLLGADSLAFEAFAAAADLFLAVSDSVYYPLSVLEMSLIAERQYNEDGNATMLQAIRHLQSEMIRDRKEHHRWQWIWWLALIITAIGGALLFYFLRKRKPTIIVPISREDLERNIEIVLSQGKLQTTLNWHDYKQFCKTANAYLYNVTDKLLVAAPQLTEQDIRFLVLVLLDLSAKEIADLMSLSQNSISNKKTRTAQKLGTIAADLRDTIISIILNS